MSISTVDSGSAGLHSLLEMESTEAVPWEGNSEDWNETAIRELDITMRFNDSHLLSVIVYSILMVFSAVCNVTFLIKILRLHYKDQGSRMHLFLLHLAVADLLVTFLMMPLEISWARTVSWKAGDFMCKMMSFFRIFGLYLSGFILVCISLDRYFVVFRPRDTHGADKRGKIMLTTAWIASTVCSAPQAIIFHVESHPDFEWFEQCITFNSFPNAELEFLYRISAFTFLYAFPLVMMLGCHLCILWKIYLVNMWNTAGTRPHSNIEMLSHAKMRTIQLTVTIVAVFGLCWTPYNIMFFWYLIDPGSAHQVDQRIQKVLFLFACTNSCFNPLVYGYFYLRKQGDVHASHSSSDSSQNVPQDCGVRLRSAEDTQDENADTAVEKFGPHQSPTPSQAVEP